LDDYARVLPRRPKMRGTGLPSPEYVADEIAHARQALAEMKAEDIPAAHLTDAELRTLLGVTGGVTTARKRFGALSRFLDWCQDAGHIQANPCTLIARSRRPRAPQARPHFLTLAELARLWAATSKQREPAWRDLIRLLIAVPCRRNEAARLDWSHLDLVAAEWRQPGRMTKNRDPHRLHLHSLALEVLRVRHDATGGKGLVFPAPVSGRPIDTFTDIKAALVNATASEAELNQAPDELDGWTWHDFRRSFATALGEAGIPEVVVADAILNHRQSATRGGVLGVYQRASRWPEQVRAMDLWGKLLAEAINGRGTPANVVAMVTRVG
jgi:integrase